MNNRQIARLINEFKRMRVEWLDMLVKNPEYTDAAQHIVTINSKIELLRSLWNWNDEEMDMP
jgi:hypothetical protein